jgi:hypothetical protein
MARSFPRPPSKSNLPLAFGLFVFGALTFSIPALVTANNANLLKESGGLLGLSTKSEHALPINSVRRGPYINAGSRDVGIDKDWTDGVYNKKYASQEAYKEYQKKRKEKLDEQSKA